MKSKNVKDILIEAYNRHGPSDGTPEYIWRVEETIGELSIDDRTAQRAIGHFNAKVYARGEL